MADADALTITQAGRQAMVAPDGKGTQAVTIAEIAVGNGRYTPTETQTELVSETKRLSSIAGSAQNPDVMDVKLLDESTETYEVGEFGLFLGDGTLFAVYSHPAGPLYEKAQAAAFGVTFNVAVVAIDATQITFPTASFATPTATQAAHGVVRLATSAEAYALESPHRALTPAQMRDTYRGLLVGAVNSVLPHVETDDHKLAITDNGDGSLTVAAGQTWIWRGAMRISADGFSEADRSFPTDNGNAYHLRWHAPGTGQAQPAADYPEGRLVLVDMTAEHADNSNEDTAYDSTYDDMLIAGLRNNGGSLTINLKINAARIRERITIYDDTDLGDGENQAKISGGLSLDYAVRPTIVIGAIGFSGSWLSGDSTPDQDTNVDLPYVARSVLQYSAMRDGANSITLNLYAMVG